MSPHGAARSSLRTRGAIALLAAAATVSYAPVAQAYHEGDERIVDATAHTLRAWEARVGLWEVELGPVDFITVGTDTAPWAASFVIDSVVENGHAKLRLVHTKPLTLSIAAAVYHTSLSPTGRLVAGSGSMLLVPITAFVSTDLTSNLSLHFSATYARLDAEDVAIDVGDSRARGAFAASALQLHGMGEYRVSRVIALTLQVHGQPYSTPASVRVTTTDVLGDKIGFSGTVGTVDRTGIAAVASIAFSGKNVNARIGAGYGALFLPTMGITIPINTVFPEVDAYVRF